jgi:ABC-type transport system involved in multi-copper enzyme maturation permease subunit
MKLAKYEYLETEPIRLDYGVYGIVHKKKDDFAPTFRLNITIGVVLCILGVVPMMLSAAFSLGDVTMIYCVGVLLLCIACGVFMFVYAGMINSGFDKLLQEGDYTPEKKEIGKKTAWFSGVYWCAVTALYLAVSFYTGKWDITWIVWPVAGVLFAAISGILQAAMRSKN